MRYITPEEFQEIQELVVALAPSGESKIDIDAWAMLLASILDEERSQEQQARQRAKKRRKRAA